MHRLVEYGVRNALSVEDLPLAVIQGRSAKGELAHCALFAAQHILARSAGRYELRHWRVTVQCERVIFEPCGTFLPKPLPGVWEFG